MALPIVRLVCSWRQSERYLQIHSWKTWGVSTHFSVIYKISSMGAYWGISTGLLLPHFFPIVAEIGGFALIVAGCQKLIAACCQIPLIVASCGQKCGKCCVLRPNFQMLRVAGYLNTSQQADRCCLANKNKPENGQRHRVSLPVFILLWPEPTLSVLDQKRSAVWINILIYFIQALVCDTNKTFIF